MVSKDRGEQVVTDTLPVTKKDQARTRSRATMVTVCRSLSLRSSSAPCAFTQRAASRDQVQGVGGLDPASQLLAPPAYQSPYSLTPLLGSLHHITEE